MSPRRVAKALAGFGVMALAVIVLAAVWIVNHRENARTATRILGMVPGALLHAHNFHWTQMKGSQKQWELNADEASYSKDKTSLNLTEANLAMTMENGNFVHLFSPHAILYLSGNHVNRADLSGGIELHYADIVVRTPDIVFFPDQDEMKAAGDVKINGNNFVLTGIGMKAHPHAQQFTILSDVNTDLIPGTQRGATSKKL
jgi:LPS export ABC transporter protein LptC